MHLRPYHTVMMSLFFKPFTKIKKRKYFKVVFQ